LIIDNFIPAVDRDKVTKRAFYDDDEEVWKMKPLTTVQT